MALEKEYDDFDDFENFDDFDELAEALQQGTTNGKQASKKLQSGASKKTQASSHPKSTTAKRNISKKDIPPYIKVYKPAVEQPVKKQQPMAKQQKDKKKDPFDEFDSIDDFDNLAETLQREQVPRVGKSPEEISAIADEISRNLQKQFDEEDRQRAKQAKKKQAKDIKKAKEYKKPVRYTEPKKRNMLTRIIHKRKYKNGYYDEIENDLLDGYYTRNDVKVSQHATKRKDRKLYKKVQAYEDARDDKTAGKVFNALAASLAGVMILATVAVGYTTYDYVKQGVNEAFGTSQTETSLEYEDMDKDTQIFYSSKIQKLLESIKETDGYEFDYLSEEELIEGYAKILKKEKKMTSESTFKSAFSNVAENGDMKLLDRIAEESLGTEEYSALTDEQKRDYRQLAYEILPTALPEFFGEDSEYIGYIRNPIVVDEIDARDSAEDKGYKITLWSNKNLKRADTIKTLGSLQHIIHEMDEYDYSALEITDGGQSIMEDWVIQAVGGEETYEQLDKNAKRDFLQIAYEWSDAAKKYMVDPIDYEKQIDDYTI